MLTAGWDEAEIGCDSSHVAPLVGRQREIIALAGMLDQAINGNGCVLGVVGPAGIGKSRIARETAAIASARGVEVISTYCESHTSGVPFHAVSGLLRTVFGVA